MSNVNRYRYGDQNLISAPVDKTTVVEIGDFMARAIAGDHSGDSTITTNYCCPVTYLTNGVTATEVRERCAQQFLGIAVSASKNGDEDPVLIATEGFFELTQKAAAAIHVGDGLEIYASATNCEDQTVVEGANSPVAVCVKHKAGAVLTGVLCKLLPSKLIGGEIS